MKMRKKNTKPPSSRFNSQSKISSLSKDTQNSPLASNARKPKILWVNAYCLLDTSSGASISIRQMLHQLQRSGYDVSILGATNFDSPLGAVALKDQLNLTSQNNGTLLKIKDGPLTHHLVKTQSTIRDKMTMDESTRLYGAYIGILQAAKPDIVFFYGGQLFDFMIPHEARVRGIPSAAYLVNANYRNSRWCRDVDLIITDTHATANFYAKDQGFIPKPVGKFIDPGKVISKEHQRKHATLINPSWSKGAGIVAMLAVLLEEKRPDITFEVVESRGSWAEVVRSVTREVWGSERTELKNVVVTPNTDDISEVYARSRIVLGLSQWWESGSRVLAEAMLNGIPAMVSNYGGSPEMVGDGGIIVNLPPGCHQTPFTSMPRPENLNELVRFLEQVWDDEPFYLNLIVRALQQGNKLHRMEVSTQRLLEAFRPLLEMGTSDGDYYSAVRSQHKHGLDESDGDFLRKKNTSPKDIPRILERQVNPDDAIKSFLEANESVALRSKKNRQIQFDSRCVNLIHPGGDWILEKFARVLGKGLENAKLYDYRQINENTQGSPLDNPDAINYYIHYNLFVKKSKGIDVALFTHVEEGVQSLSKRFFDVASIVDYGIFISPKYKIASRLPDEKSKVILPGIDEHFFSHKLILGVVGRDYSYTDRKNSKLLEKIRRIPFVDVRFTGGALVDEDLVKFYREIDYVFTPSTIEGGPMSLLEGLASGKKSIFPRDVGLWSEFEDVVITYDHNNFDGLIKTLEDLRRLKLSLVNKVEALTWGRFVKSHEEVFIGLRRKFGDKNGASK